MESKKTIAFINVNSPGTDASFVPLKTDKAAYLGLSKISLLLGCRHQYQLFDCSPNKSIEKMSYLSDLVAVHFSCNQSSIDEFITTNFRYLGNAVYLLENDQYNFYKNRNLFKKWYRLSKDCVRAIPYNVDFETAVVQNKIIPFLNFYVQGRVCNQNHEFLKALISAHMMIEVRLRGGPVNESSGY